MLMMMACSKLTTIDLGKVRNEVFSAAAKWYDIGLELGVTADYLDTIKKANDDPLDCLRELLRRWLSNVDPQPSREALVAALRIPAVNYPALASEIELKFCGASIKSTENQTQPVSSLLNSVTDNDLPSQGSPSNTMTDPVNVVNDYLSASTPKPRPVPKPRHRTKSVDDPLKRELVQSFEGATSSEVTQGQIERAEKCIKDGGSHDERYNLIEFDKILNENKVSGHVSAKSGLRRVRTVWSASVQCIFFHRNIKEPTISH